MKFRLVRTRRTAASGAPSRARLAVERLESRWVPSGVPAVWVPRGAGGGGSLFSAAYSPFNNNEMYVSSDMSQLFHTTDAGGTWQTVDFRQLQGNHESRVQFTEDPAV